MCYALLAVSEGKATTLWILVANFSLRWRTCAPRGKSLSMIRTENVWGELTESKELLKDKQASQQTKLQWQRYLKEVYKPTKELSMAKAGMI
jgi:hypothetical protein